MKAARPTRARPKAVNQGSRRRSLLAPPVILRKIALPCSLRMDSPAAPRSLCRSLLHDLSRYSDQIVVTSFSICRRNSNLLPHQLGKHKQTLERVAPETVWVVAAIESRAVARSSHGRLRNRWIRLVCSKRSGFRAPSWLHKRWPEWNRRVCRTVSSSKRSAQALGEYGQLEASRPHTQRRTTKDELTADLDSRRSTGFSSPRMNDSFRAALVVTPSHRNKLAPLLGQTLDSN